MYSWKTIRTAFAILLLLPILHLALLVSQEVVASLDPSPQTWQGEVDALTAVFNDRQLPLDPIVVVGGRRVKLWPGLEDLLRPRPVIMLGVGDATLDDIIHYHGQLVGYYRPSAVVLLPDNAEFHVRDNKSAPELAAAIRKLVELDQSFSASRQYYVFVPVKSPLYPEDYGTIDGVARLLEQWAGDQPQVKIIDANALLGLSSGTPNPDFFRMDGSSLNEHGYLRMSLLLQDQLASREVTPPGQ